MTYLQRDREGVLRPVRRVSIDRKLFEIACELSGGKILGGLLETLAIRFINSKRRERGEDPFVPERGQ